MQPSRQEERPQRRLLRPLLITLAVAALVLLLWQVVHVVLLFFGGVLVAAGLRAIAEPLAARTRLSYPWAFGLVLFGLLALLAALGVAIAPQVNEQASQLSEELPAAIDRLTAGVRSQGWYEQAVEWMGGGVESTPSPGRLLRGMALTAQGCAGMLVILFVGLYMGARPELYLKGALHLVPLRRRERVAEVLHEIDRTLQWWLVAKLASMTVVGLLTGIGLWALDIPMALTLALLAATLTFVPNFGPVASAVPPVLLGLLESPMKALWVIVLFLAIQTVESYLITPLIEHRTVAVPPAVVILAEIVMAVLFGILGLVLATPLAVMAMVAINRFYVEDVLGDRVEHPVSAPGD